MAGKHQLQIALKSTNGIDWSNKKVLDIGCSNGSLTIEILKLTKAQEIVGVDLDEERIAKAKKLIKNQRNNKLKFLPLDANNMQVFPDGSFDAVFSNMTFQQFADFSVPLKEVFRLLKPKGVAIINFNQEKAEVFLRIGKLKAKYLREVYKASKKKKISAEKFKKVAQKIGFRKVDVKSKHDICYFNNVDDLIDSSGNFSPKDKENNQLWQKAKEVLHKQKTNRGYKEIWNIVFAQLVK